MAKTAMIRVRMEPKLKVQAEKVFKRLGINATTAINLFYHQIVEEKGLPFEARIPNRASRQALRESNDPGRRAKLKTYASAQEMMDDILGKGWR